MLKVVTYLVFNVNNDVRKHDGAGKFRTYDVNVINAVKNEPLIWDSIVNVTEEEKQLTWRRIYDLFGGKKVSYPKHTGVILLLKISFN